MKIFFVDIVILPMSLAIEEQAFGQSCSLHHMLHCHPQDPSSSQSKNSFSDGR
jgi:hypothetical protein